MSNHTNLQESIWIGHVTVILGTFFENVARLFNSSFTHMFLVPYRASPGQGGLILSPLYNKNLQYCEIIILRGTLILVNFNVKLKLELKQQQTIYAIEVQVYKIFKSINSSTYENASFQLSL